MIYDAARVTRLCTKFQVNTSKKKNSFWGVIYVEALRAGDWTAVNIKS